jgi:hypothetical protein
VKVSDHVAFDPSMLTARPLKHRVFWSWQAVAQAAVRPGEFSAS